MNKVNTRIRVIYHLMLNEEIFVFDPRDRSCGRGQRIVWTNDNEAAKAIINCSTEDMSALEIAKILASRL